MSKAKIWLGPSGIPSVSRINSSIEGIKTVAGIGLNAMEINFTHGIHMGLDMARECGETSKEFDIRLSVHAPYYINLLSKKERIINESEKRILDSVERAHIMNADMVVFHTGYYTGLSKDAAFKIVKQKCEEMTNIMEKKGWLDVRLGLETSGKHSAFGYLDELLALNKSNKQCIPVLDFAHIFAKDYGKIDYGKIFDRVKKFKHLHTHFSGIEYTSKGERVHLTIEHNQPPFEPLGKEILKRKLSITIISESPILEIDSLKMQKIFQKLGYRFKKTIF